MTHDHADVVVIGGGLHGLSAALYLARAGKRVVILERAWVGRHASGATAAGVRTLGRDLAEVPISLEAMDMWHRIETIVGDTLRLSRPWPDQGCGDRKASDGAERARGEGEAARLRA